MYSDEKSNRILLTFKFKHGSDFRAELAKARQVAYVVPQHTSQQCSGCGLLGHRTGKDFVCSCGHVDHPDANTSFNITVRPALEEGDGRWHRDRNWYNGRIDAPQEATS
jgi:transposase